MPASRFIDRYQAILLDVCGTLMFNYDRFAEGDDHHSTYTQLAGAALSPGELYAIIHQLHLDIMAAEQVETNYDPFPSLGEFVRRLPAAQNMPAEEQERIAQVFARHECGRIPASIADALLVLSETHPLGIVSNIWSLAAVFEAELERAGVRELLYPRVWSADYGCIKPAEKIFRIALEELDCPPDRVLYVGDTYLRDVVGARRVGMGTAWVNPHGLPVPQGYAVQPDLVIHSVTDLLAR
jgi:HAD superfamily hydrolase (TIGR01549 family)